MPMSMYPAKPFPEMIPRQAPPRHPNPKKLRESALLPISRLRHCERSPLLCLDSELLGWAFLGLPPCPNRQGFTLLNPPSPHHHVIHRPPSSVSPSASDLSQRAARQPSTASPQASGRHRVTGFDLAAVLPTSTTERPLQLQSACRICGLPTCTSQSRKLGRCLVQYTPAAIPPLC